MLAKKQAEKLLKEKKEKEKAEMLAKKQAEELLKKQKKEALMLAQKQKTELLAQKKETELQLIEEKKQKEEELATLKKEKKLKVSKEKKLKVFKEKKLAKLTNSLMNELDKIDLIEIKKVNTVPKIEEVNFVSSFGNLNYNEKLNDSKKIEEAINKVFASLDLESRIALAKIILEDAVKPEFIKKNETSYGKPRLTENEESNNKFNNQLFFLERLLDHAGIKYNKIENFNEKN